MSPADLSEADLAAAGLRLCRDGAVATITLHRPEVRNAQTPLMWRTLAAIGAALIADDQVRVVVINAAGQSFSAGLDLAMLAQGNDSDAETVAGLLAGTDQQIVDTIGEYQAGFSFLRHRRLLSIAAVQGHAIGAGFQLALACDFRIVSPDVQFCMKEAALGLVPDLTGTAPLVQCVGYSRALEICSTARLVGADEALRIGLATAVADDLPAATAELVAAVTQHPVGAVREIKELLAGAAHRDDAAQHLAERTAQVRRFRDLAGG